MYKTIVNILNLIKLQKKKKKKKKLKQKYFKEKTLKDFFSKKIYITLIANKNTSGGPELL